MPLFTWNFLFSFSDPIPACRCARETYSQSPRWRGFSSENQVGGLRPVAMDRVLKERPTTSASTWSRIERYGPHEEHRNGLRPSTKQSTTIVPAKAGTKGLDLRGRRQTDDNSNPDAGELEYDSSSSESPSDCSPLTPGDKPAALTIKKRPPPLRLNGEEHKDQTFHVHIAARTDSLSPPVHKFEKPPASPAPLLQPSLVTLADWNYSRFSTLFEDPKSTQIQTEETMYHNPYSPIEIATPVSFQQPKMRPSVVKVVNIGSKSRSGHLAVPSSHTATGTQILTPKASKPDLADFLASEAIPVDFSDIEDKRADANARSASSLSTLTLRPIPDSLPVLHSKSSAPVLSLSSRFSSGVRTSTVVLNSVPGGPLSSHPSHEKRPSTAVVDLGTAPSTRTKSRLRQISNPRAPPVLSRPAIQQNNSAAPVQRSSSFPLTHTSFHEATVPALPIQSAPNPFSYTPITAAVVKEAPQPFPRDSNANAKVPSALHVARKKSMSALTQTFKHALGGSISRLSTNHQPKPSDPWPVPRVPALPSLNQGPVKNKNHNHGHNPHSINVGTFDRRRELDEPLPPTPRITDTKAIWMGSGNGDHMLSRKASVGRSKRSTGSGPGIPAVRKENAGNANEDEATLTSNKWTSSSVQLKDFPTPPVVQQAFGCVSAGREGSRRTSRGGSRGGSRPQSSHLR